MSDVKFTPGPWEVGGPYPSVSVVHYVAGSGVDEPPIYEPVCIIDERLMGEPNEHSLADARLIAAAPDLLEACRSIAKLGLHRTFTCANGGPPDAECHKCIALAAIAKAEGTNGASTPAKINA